MIQQVFPQNFYGLITPPNKNEVLEHIQDVHLTEDQNFGWGSKCIVKRERIDGIELFQLLKPSFEKFISELGITCGLRIQDSWRNTYVKGYFQEIHDHLPADLSAVLFTNDHEEGSGEFYFYNRNSSELTPNWYLNILRDPSYHHVKYKKGDIIFFPSHMLHGVTPYMSDTKRITFALNFEIVFDFDMNHRSPQYQ